MFIPGGNGVWSDGVEHRNESGDEDGDADNTEDNDLPPCALVCLFVLEGRPSCCTQLFSWFTVSPPSLSLQIDLEPEGKVYVVIDLSGSSTEGKKKQKTPQHGCFYEWKGQKSHMYIRTGKCGAVVRSGKYRNATCKADVNESGKVELF